MCKSQGTTFASPLDDPGNARPSCPPPKRAPLRLSTNDDARRLVSFTTRRKAEISPNRDCSVLIPDYLFALRMQFLIDVELTLMSRQSTKTPADENKIRCFSPFGRFHRIWRFAPCATTKWRRGQPPSYPRSSVLNRSRSIPSDKHYHTSQEL